MPAGRKAMCPYLKPEWKDIRRRDLTWNMTDGEIVRVWAARRLLAFMRGVRPDKVYGLRLDNPYLPEDALDLLYAMRSCHMETRDGGCG